MNSTTIKDFIEKSRKNQTELTADLKAFHCPDISREDYLLMLTAKAGELLYKRGVQREFIIDGFNLPVIHQFYYYLTSDRTLCKLDIDKGIYLMGKVGCGKSLLMSAHLFVQDALTNKVTTVIHAKELGNEIIKQGFSMLKNKPLFIDEIGRENLEVMNYGTTIKPVADLLALRYESGGRTYGTSNYTLEKLEALRDEEGNVKEMRYGRFIRSRMEEMFNIVELPGEDRRYK
ncbi:hypothetical protein EZS27_000352 [termite gut metagenome]|uniref:Uncharacterized protein n=1 Tax=termite gut metagenome TaxID=433724 RepID=A0A5J4T3A4_9ZZZZ